MPRELCPLLMTSRQEEKAQCKKDDCKWFIHLEGKPSGIGVCGITKIGAEICRLNSELHNIMRLLGDKL